MIDLPYYSLIIEATEEPDYFGFYSPDLRPRPWLHLRSPRPRGSGLPFGWTPCRMVECTRSLARRSRDVAAGPWTGVLPSR